LGPVTGARAEVEDPPRRAVETLECRRERRRSPGAREPGPAGCEGVELCPERTTEEAPEPRPAHDDTGREAREPLARRDEALVHESSAVRRISWPTTAANISAAFPWLIASAMFPYASS